MKMNLQMFAEANTQTTGGLSAEMKTYYGMELLENAKPQLVHNQFAATKGLPAGGGKTVEWRKFGAFDKALKPLTEGVTPDGSGISVSYITKDIVRHKLVTRIVNAYNAYDKKMKENKAKTPPLLSPLHIQSCALKKNEIQKVRLIIILTAAKALNFFITSDLTQSEWLLRHILLSC